MLETTSLEMLSRPRRSRHGGWCSLPVPAGLVAFSLVSLSLPSTCRTFLVLPELKQEVKVWESTQSEWYINITASHRQQYLARFVPETPESLLHTG